MTFSISFCWPYSVNSLAYAKDAYRKAMENRSAFPASGMPFSIAVCEEAPGCAFLWVVIQSPERLGHDRNSMHLATAKFLTETCGVSYDESEYSPRVASISEIDSCVASRGITVYEVFRQLATGPQDDSTGSMSKTDEDITMLSASSYLDECLSSGLEDLPEERDAYRMPDVQPAHILGSGCATPEHVRLGHDLIREYPDLDMPYYWLSHYYLLKNDHQTARRLLEQGIGLCRRKRWLCGEYGELEYYAGNLREAVKWWARHAVLQIASSTYEAYSCFMYLGYVADWCSLPAESSLLFRVTDAIRCIRLNDIGQKELYLMTRNTDTSPVAQTIRRLVASHHDALSAIAG